jgi:hypothetical protein
VKAGINYILPAARMASVATRQIFARRNLFAAATTTADQVTREQLETGMLFPQANICPALHLTAMRSADGLAASCEKAQTTDPARFGPRIEDRSPKTGQYSAKSPGQLLPENWRHADI